MDIYIYLSFVLIMIFLSYGLFIKSKEYCPVKVREVNFIILVLVMFRVMALWGLLVLDHMKIVYLIRNFVFLNVIYIPLIMFVCLYVFYRNTKINLKWFYYIFILGVGAYICCIFFIPMEYYISPSYGYNIVLSNGIPYKYLLCLSGICFFLGMQALRYKYSVKWGIALVEGAALFFVVSTALVLRSTENVGFLLLGEIVWLFVLYCSIRSFKKEGA